MSLTDLAPSATKVLETIASTSIFKTAEKEIAARTAAERKKLSEALEQLDGVAGPDFQKWQIRLSAAIADYRAAEQKMHDAARTLNEMRGTATATLFSAQTQREQLAAKLRTTCHPAIAPFIAEMRDAWSAVEKLRAPAPIVTRNEVTNAVTVSGISIGADVRRRIEAIRSAIEAAEAMKLDADQSKIPERLEKLKSGLPGVPGAEGGGD
jgi:hypothetical protein